MDTLKRRPGRQPGARPDLWCTGPDPLHHRMYTAYGYMMQSARQRGDTWALTWPDFRDIWQHHWPERGKHRHSLCLSRIDFQAPWHRDNVELVTRSEFGRRVRRYYS